MSVTQIHTNAYWQFKACYVNAYLWSLMVVNLFPTWPTCPAKITSAVPQQNSNQVVALVSQSDGGLHMSFFVNHFLCESFWQPVHPKKLIHLGVKQLTVSVDELLNCSLNSFFFFFIQAYLVTLLLSCCYDDLWELNY